MQKNVFRTVNDVLKITQNNVYGRMKRKKLFKTRLTLQIFIVVSNGSFIKGRRETGWGEGLHPILKFEKKFSPVKIKIFGVASRSSL